MNSIPLILDTDIGSDIDDAVALAYLLEQPRCDLVGITTVSGEPDRRASLADAICRAAGRTGIPIHVGTADPILVPQRQPAAPQAEALTDKWPHATFSGPGTAVRFLQETIRSRPGEITLLTIGPLTNIGLLFALDPEIPGLLKQLVMMGGRYFTRSSRGAVLEWNILCDPHAAARVFQAPDLSITAVGLDVTEHCTLSAGECRERFTAAGGSLAPVAAMAEVWFRNASHVTFHDPLAAALIFEPELCRLEPAQIEVDLLSAAALGHTLLRQGSDPTLHRAAAAVNSEKFFQHYFSVVGGRQL